MLLAVYWVIILSLGNWWAATCVLVFSSNQHSDWRQWQFCDGYQYLLQADPLRQSRSHNNSSLQCFTCLFCLPCINLWKIPLQQGLSPSSHQNTLHAVYYTPPDNIWNFVCSAHKKKSNHYRKKMAISYKLVIIISYTSTMDSHTRGIKFKRIEIEHEWINKIA